MTIGVAAVSDACGSCRSEIAPGMLACPGCGALVHAGRLKELAAEASRASAAGDRAEVLRAWRESLPLLPDGSTQHAVIRERVAALSLEAETTPPPAPSGPWRWLATLGPAGAILWKFKFLVVALVTKGKLLVLGLTKASTVFSMLLAFGVYWTQWGPWFALGLVVSVYVHEMGHVAALKQYGIPASAPMFIPGFGALVRLRQAPISRREDARIGLAGPIWGSGAALVAFAIGSGGARPLWLAIAHTGAWLNLFNLLPVWQLDGNRAFAAMTKSQRGAAAAALGVAYFFCGDGLLILLALAAIVRTAGHDAPDAPDTVTLVNYVALVGVLALLISAANSI